MVGTCRVLATARELGVWRVVYPSTPDVPWLNPYKITKQAAERFCQLYHRVRAGDGCAAPDQRVRAP